MTHRHIQFVTGRLAASALQQVVQSLHEKLGWQFSVDVLPITVAALMNPKWVARHWTPNPAADLILLPGYCLGDLEPLQAGTTVRVERGPRDLWSLPEYFGQAVDRSGYGDYTIEILAEINHAPTLKIADILAQAAQLADDGADIIDLGCNPGEPWRDVDVAVRALLDAGRRVSIDSFDHDEVQRATSAGAELVLSVNRSNREAASDWGCEVVVIPDQPHEWETMQETAEYLSARKIPFRLDPILEPIGCGFSASVRRYFRTRDAFPQAAMMMGIGNLTELTDVDSAGVNVILLALCEELRVGSVLTTQVIPWAQSSVRECDLARRLLHFAVQRGITPKRLDERLVMLRDARRHVWGEDFLDELSHSIRDRNYRLFAERGAIHLISRHLHLSDADPFQLFERLLAEEPTNMDASHAFYLGYEMCKAVTALTLGKLYWQDQPLDWGFLTRKE